MEKERKGGILPTVFIVLLFAAGLGVLLYPTVSDLWNSFHQSRAILNYTRSVGSISEAEYARYLGEAEAYNEALFAQGVHYAVDEGQQAEYDRLLNISGDGIMGYVEIPSINVSLPVYHGTSESVLQVAVGHLEWSSLPVGGENTHCVLSGHRGLPSAKLFTDLDRVVVGDLFMLYVLNRILTYQVEEIEIVLPEEVDSLQIRRGMDLCTLVTCTPYGVNTHRILVKGRRVPNSEDAAMFRPMSDGVQVDPVMAAPFAAIPLLLVLGLWYLGDNKYKDRWDA